MTSRMERDSNPRYSYQYFGFQDRLFQPLRHPSLRASPALSICALAAPPTPTLCDSLRLLAPHPVSWLYCLPVSDTFPIVRIATLRFFLYDNMHRRRSLRVIAREWRTNDPPKSQQCSDWVRLKWVSERRGKRASSTRERSESEGPIL